MLRQFQFIDQNGKDQGVNVRNRSKELAELLGDVERIRAERKKARSNRNKFGGVEGGGMSGGTSSGSRYGGFGSEDAGYGGYSGGTYGDGGGFGGNSSSGFQDSGVSTATTGSSGRKDRFEEYDEEDDGAVSSPTAGRRKTTMTSSNSVKPKSEVAKKKEPEVDLFSFGDDEIPPMTPPKPAVSNGKQSLTSASQRGNGAVEEDDFDDFISATPSTQTSIPGLPLPSTTSTAATKTQFVAPKPVSASQGLNLSDLVGFSSVSPAPGNQGGYATPNYNLAPTSGSYLATTPGSNVSNPSPSQPLYQQPTTQPKPTGYKAAQPNYFTSVPAPSANTPSNGRPGLSSTSSFGGQKPLAKSSSAAGGDAFGSLWSTASAGAGIKKTPVGGQGPRLADMAKEKASQGIWGTGTTSSTSSLSGTSQQQQQQQPRPFQTQQKAGGGLDDLLG